MARFRTDGMNECSVHPSRFGSTANASLVRSARQHGSNSDSKCPRPPSATSIGLRSRSSNSADRVHLPQPSSTHRRRDHSNRTTSSNPSDGTTFDLPVTRPEPRLATLGLECKRLLATLSKHKGALQLRLICVLSWPNNAFDEDIATRWLCTNPRGATDQVYDKLKRDGEWVQTRSAKLSSVFSAVDSVGPLLFQPRSHAKACLA